MHLKLIKGITYEEFEIYVYDINEPSIDLLEGMYFVGVRPLIEEPWFFYNTICNNKSLFKYNFHAQMSSHNLLQRKVFLGKFIIRGLLLGEEP